MKTAVVCRLLGVQHMDIRSLTASQIHDLNAATDGEFLSVLHENMISGPFFDADISVDFLGLGFRIDLVFGRGRDGHLGSMATFVTAAKHELPEEVRLGLLVLQVECFQRRMADRFRRSVARGMPKHG